MNYPNGDSCARKQAELDLEQTFMSTSDLSNRHRRTFANGEHEQESHPEETRVGVDSQGDDGPRDERGTPGGVISAAGGGPARHWVVRASVGGLLAVMCLLAGFAIVTQTRGASLSRRADAANTLSSVYQDARFWVGQEESLERKYRLEPGAAVLRLHDQAEQNLTADLRRLARLDSSPSNRLVVTRLLRLDARYARASAGMFDAVDAHQTALVIHFDHAIVDPVFGVMQNIVYQNAADSSQRSLAQTAALRRNDRSARDMIVVAFAAGLALLLGLGLLIGYFRRRLDTALRAEVVRLGEMAITDPLTGMRNHRAFHEDLTQSLQRTGPTNLVSLVMLDLDKLKVVNDSLGHQAGDDRITMLADVIRRTEPGADCAYRIGGDEFAVILDQTRAWNALEFAQRLDATLAIGRSGVNARVSAGISENVGSVDKDTLIRQADLALLAAKRSGQTVAIYVPEMELRASSGDVEDEHHTRTLANALSLAVDAKDAYTRSHSQTVSQLSAVIATALGLEPARVARIRLAGLLHDVGKIGIPDAILNKPAKLTEDEYEQMKGHALVGHDIVFAADMPTEARWIRHHHERYDGRGYPDRISGDAIPLESRIIFVADSFEAMTSDRPYRKAPGHQYAIDELHRNSGTQFDPEVVDAICQTLQHVGQSDTSGHDTPPIRDAKNEPAAVGSVSA
jgi:diguanylate cyclase (GGDEF)-like protein